MTYVQFPYATLASLGTNLQDLSGKLGERRRGAEDCQGLGSGDQHRVQVAIEAFRDEWKTSFRDLDQDINNWGGLSKAIGDMVGQFDAEAGRALAPPD